MEFSPVHSAVYESSLTIALVPEAVPVGARVSGLHFVGRQASQGVVGSILIVMPALRGDLLCRVVKTQEFVFSLRLSARDVRLAG